MLKSEIEKDKNELLHLQINVEKKIFRISQGNYTNYHKCKKCSKTCSEKNSILCDLKKIDELKNQIDKKEERLKRLEKDY